MVTECSKSHLFWRNQEQPAAAQGPWFSVCDAGTRAIPWITRARLWISLRFPARRNPATNHLAFPARFLLFFFSFVPDSGFRGWAEKRFNNPKKALAGANNTA